MSQAITEATLCLTADAGRMTDAIAIGDMPLELQPKILRVLQEREFEAIGSTRTTKVPDMSSPGTHFSG
jgi:transcriptional regulator of acetoin/glycerol metabolism